MFGLTKLPTLLLLLLRFKQSACTSVPICICIHVRSNDSIRMLLEVEGHVPMGMYSMDRMLLFYLPIFLSHHSSSSIPLKWYIILSWKALLLLWILSRSSIPENVYLMRKFRLWFCDSKYVYSLPCKCLLGCFYCRRSSACLSLLTCWSAREPERMTVLRSVSKCDYAMQRTYVYLPTFLNPQVWDFLLGVSTN